MHINDETRQAIERVARNLFDQVIDIMDSDEGFEERREMIAILTPEGEELLISSDDGLTQGGSVEDDWNDRLARLEVDIDYEVRKTLGVILIQSTVLRGS